MGTEVNEVVLTLANVLSVSMKGPIGYVIAPAVAAILIAVAFKIARRAWTNER